MQILLTPRGCSSTVEHLCGDVGSTPANPTYSRHCLFQGVMHTSPCNTQHIGHSVACSVNFAHVQCGAFGEAAAAMQQFFGHSYKMPQ
jgi:hypothetical protein